MYGFFIDLKAVFDKVDRKILWRAMEERSIRRGLIERVKEIYEQTKNAVRVHGNNKLVRDEKRSKTGMPLQPVALCPSNSRCRRGDEERTSRRSMDREKQHMDIGIRSRSGTVSKERKEHEGNDEKTGKIPKKQKPATQHKEVENAVL